MGVVILGMGANVGSRDATIEAARTLMEQSGISILKTSPLYETDPIGPPQSKYLNAAVCVKTTMSLRQLLGVLQEIEAKLGRVRSKTQRWLARTIDLDILWAEHDIAEAGLIVPHAHLKERTFALAPLLDVAPELKGMYGDVLQRLGGKPPLWQGRPIVRRKDQTMIVDAQDLPSALAALGKAGQGHQDEPIGQSVKVIPKDGDKGMQGWVEAWRGLISEGIPVLHAPVWHCSKAQWKGVFVYTEGAKAPIDPGQISLGSSPCRRIRVTLRFRAGTINAG